MSHLLNLIELVQAVEARNRIPDDLKNTHPYSIFALWTYYALGDPDSKCNYCSQFDGQTFTGADLRVMFPDHEWDGSDIYPNVHMTLWGKDTCKCRLIREPNDEPPIHFSPWNGGVSTDWKYPTPGE